MKPPLTTAQGQIVWTPELVAAMAAMAADLDRGRAILAKSGSWNPSAGKWSKAA